MGNNNETITMEEAVKLVMERKDFFGLRKYDFSGVFVINSKTMEPQQDITGNFLKPAQIVDTFYTTVENGTARLMADAMRLCDASADLFGENGYLSFDFLIDTVCGR